MKLTSKPLALIVFVILFGGIALTTVLGWWQTETSKEPARYTDGEAAGQYNPADIRGSYTFGDVSRLFDVPLEDLKTAFVLPADADAAAFALKSLEALYAEQDVEVGTGSMRLFVALYKGLPYELADGTYLPRPAVEILKQRGTLSADQLAFIEANAVELDGAAPAVEDTPASPVEPTVQPAQAEPTAAVPAATQHSPEERTVTGSTTFQDLLDWGVPLEKIEEIIGGSMPTATTIVKDYIRAQGLEFAGIKTSLQAEVDKR